MNSLKVAEEEAVRRLLILPSQELHEGRREFFVADLSVFVRVDDLESSRRFLLVVTEQLEEALQLGDLDESILVRVDDSKHKICHTLVESSQAMETLLAEQADEVLGRDGLRLAVGFDDLFPDR